MNSILVTTDFSANSKAAIRFAAQLASQTGASLTILHVFSVLRASDWTDNYYEQNVALNREVLERDMKSFLRGVFRSLHLPVSYRTDLYHSMDVPSAILAYAAKNEIGLVCIGARGAGTMKKLFGSISQKLIRQASLPVLCIPPGYKIKPLSHIMYACDMHQYEQELKQVVSFAQPMKASVELLYMSFAYDTLPDQDLMSEVMSTKAGYPVSLHYEQRDIDHSLLEDIDQAVNRSKPSLLVMFTDKTRTFTDRLFASSVTEKYSFRSKVPLLIFNKKRNDVAAPKSGKKKPVKKSKV